MAQWPGSIALAYCMLLLYMQVNDCDLPGTLDGQLGIEMTVDSSENYQLLHSAIRWGDAEVLFDAAFCGFTSIARWRSPCSRPTRYARYFDPISILPFWTTRIEPPYYRMAFGLSFITLDHYANSTCRNSFSFESFATVAGNLLELRT